MLLNLGASTNFRLVFLLMWLYWWNWSCIYLYWLKFDFQEGWLCLWFRNWEDLFLLSFTVWSTYFEFAKTSLTIVGKSCSFEILFYNSLFVLSWDILSFEDTSNEVDKKFDVSSTDWSWLDWFGKELKFWRVCVSYLCCSISTSVSPSSDDVFNVWAKGLCLNLCLLIIFGLFSKSIAFYISWFFRV